MRSELGEQEAVRLRPPQHRIEQRTLWWWMLKSLMFWVPVWIVAVGVFVVVTIANVSVNNFAAWWAVGVVVIAVFSIIGVFVEPLWRLRVHRWEVTNEAVYALTGWWTREWRVAPISRVQTVDTIRGPLEQMLGLSTLRVTTASSRGAIDIVGLNHVVASELSDQLTEVAQQTQGDAT